MKKIAIFITFLLFTASGVVASDYKYCEITGLAFGAGKNFIGSVSYRIMEKQKVVLDSVCQAVWRDAFKTSQKFSSDAKKTDQDIATMLKLSEFENKIIDSIIENMQIENIR